MPQLEDILAAAETSLDMALRLSKALGRSPESWLAIQDANDLWLARQSTDLARVSKLELATA
jgi:addiction module HigA family antidote